jgi:CDP-diacylglycerol--serine O-phosphatidyltransferase
MRVPPELVLPVFVSVVFFIALLISYPWHILSAGSALYLLSLPFGWKSYREHARKAAGASVTSAEVVPEAAGPTYSAAPAAPPDDERPERLH